MTRYVYKICEESTWANGEVLRGSATDRQDGFIHLSTAEQVPGTFAKYFATTPCLVLLRLDADTLGDRLRWEPSRGGALFPHFYGELERWQLTCVGYMPFSADGSRLPTSWQQADGELQSRADPPDDWMGVRGWDDYWTAVLDDRRRTRTHGVGSDFRRMPRRYIDSVASRKDHRVLLAGNGVAADPHGFAHAGFDVTVVEISSIACDYLSWSVATPGLLAHLFVAFDEERSSSGLTSLTRNDEKSRQSALDEHRPGGRLAIMNEDLFAHEPAAPYQAIFSVRAYQGFPRERREELARRFFRWLRPGGVAGIQMQNIHDREEFEGPFLRAGFQRVERWTEAAPAPQKSVLFWHARG